MNIIRTTAVELSTIPGIAYKQKLASGGAGIKIFRLDKDATAVGTIEKRDGEITPYGAVDETLFPAEAFEETVELTRGLPFSARGKIVIKAYDTKDAEDVEEDQDNLEIPNMIGTPEYDAIITRYSDEKGKLNFKLMNKDFIQFAAKSKTVADMAASKLPEDEILTFIIKSRAAFIANQTDNLDDLEARGLVATLDEIEARSAFKELNAHIRKMLARK